MEHETVISRTVARWRSSLVLVGALIGLLLAGGPLQSISLSPPAVGAQVINICTAGGVENDPAAIVQDCNLRADGYIGLEAEAVDALLALHGLPASDEGRVRAWERDAVRALMFSNLIEMVLKDPSERTLAEQEYVDGLAEFVDRKRITAAQYSMDQYNAWQANPCTYQAPQGFTYDRDIAWCDSELVRLTRGPHPPTLEDFLNYGFAEIYQDFEDGGAAQLIAGDTAKVLGFVGGVVAAGIASSIGAAVGATLSTTGAIISAIHPFLATTVAANAAGHAVATEAVVGTAAAGSGVLTIGAVVAIIVIAVVIIVLQAITVAAEAEIPIQLQEGLDQALAGVDLRELAQSDEGKSEIFAAFVLSTLPDFLDSGTVPAAQTTDRTFIVTDPQGVQTHSHTINYLCWSPLHCAGEKFEHTARIHEGWFVDTNDLTNAERMTLTIDYIDWNGAGWTAARIGPQEFLHTRTGDGSEEFVSEEIKYQDVNGDHMTAVMNHPPTTPATPAPNDTVNSGVFQLDWSPASTDVEGEPVTYTLFRCDESELSFIDGIQGCTESIVATDLTATSFAFTADEPEEDGLLKYRVAASDGRVQSASSPWSETVLVDQRPPVITFHSRTPPANIFGWNNSDVTVEWTCTDTEPNALSRPSGVVSETVTETVTTEGENQTVIGVCEDQAGNTAANTVGGSWLDEISIDKTAPEVVFDEPYVVDEGSSIQIGSARSSDALSGIERTGIALNGDGVFGDIDPATFYGIDGPSTHPIKMRVQDQAGNVGLAETTVMVLNVAPTIDEIVTNGPVAQGQPVAVTVTASDVGGVHDPLTYAFDCDDDGVHETAGDGNQGTCTLDPAAATSTIGVQVSDDDLGVTTSSVDVEQTLTICGNFALGKLGLPGPSGACSGGMAPLMLPATPAMLCVDVYTGTITLGSGGSCGAAQLPRAIPGSGPLAFCRHMWTGKLRANLYGGACGPMEIPGVIPG